MIKLRSAIEALARHKVKFVIVGGVAINLHSSAYVTYDLDFCYSRERENLKRIVEALAHFKPRLRDFSENLPFIWDEQTLKSGTNFTFQTNIGDIDMLGEVTGVGAFEDVLAQSKVMNLFGFEINVLSIEGLIKAKKAAGRTKDLLVLPELEALQEALKREE
ncbi:MAG TPA: hypothetical protein VK892_19985 [Pyrinomonadaceae bacterium]|nr:hypothetical protein [Pyrinomonadaceae bacterium]